MNRRSHFKDFDQQRKFTNFRDEVFPFIKSLNGRAGSSDTKFMQDAVFIMPNPALLYKVINLIDANPLHDRDTKGDLYEYMLAKIATVGQNACHPQCLSKYLGEYGSTYIQTRLILRMKD